MVDEYENVRVRVFITFLLEMRKEGGRGERAEGTETLTVISRVLMFANQICNRVATGSSVWECDFVHIREKRVRP